MLGHVVHRTIEGEDGMDKSFMANVFIEVYSGLTISLG